MSDNERDIPLADSSCQRVKIVVGESITIRDAHNTWSLDGLTPEEATGIARALLEAVDSVGLVSV